MTLGLVAVLCLNCVPNTEAAGGWSSSVSPSFAFNGDNVTMKVTGIPGNFAFIKIMLGNETLDTQLVYLDDMGHGSVVWNVPILASTGTYRFIVVSNGVNVTDASVSIVFDDVTYLRWRVDNVEHDNEQLRQIVQRAIIELEDIKGRIFWMWATASIACAFAVMFAIITVLYYLPVVKIKMDEGSRKNGLRGKAARTFKAVFDPDAPGLMLRAWPTLFAERERERKKDRPFHMQPMAIVSDPGEPLGVRAYPLEIEGVGPDAPTDEPFIMADVENAEKNEKPVEKEVLGLNIIGRFRQRIEMRRAEKKKPVDEIASLKAELEKLKAERRPVAPERVEQPPTPSSEVGTPPEKPQDAVPVVEAVEAPPKAENATKPRKNASTKPKTSKPRPKKVESKEAVE